MVGGYRLSFILFLKEAVKSFGFVLLIMKFKKSKKHFCNQKM
ncbi:putative membrane protein [Helicobacter pylori Hp P-2b]|uniref:Putative membrane protein n=1 Tax=Helicobacter pylori Hp P-2 TaxID=992073 RepID=J0PHL5_HELPX|nr:putative membrane protein [Helicobacter pylori Hp P-2]EJC56064.1 putative membrane protein [Helicobacter pylori Hp P-2b]